MKDAEGKVYKKIFNYIEMLMVLKSLCFFAKRMYSLKVFFKGRSATCFCGFHVSPFSGGLKVLGWSGSQQEMADLGGCDVVAGCQGCHPPPCWSTSKGIWDPIKYPRHIQSRELICKTCFSENGTHVFLEEITSEPTINFCSGHVSFFGG